MVLNAKDDAPNAFTYDINMETENTSLKKGSLTELKVSLNNVEGGICPPFLYEYMI